ncbi:MAG: SBBP repeat-containing protein [bacterium]|nr:SBBP repeat-containing protein [bacterium]
MRYCIFFMVMGLGARGYAQWTWTDVRGSAQYDDARAVSTPTPYGSYTAGEAGAAVDGQPYAGAGDVLLIRHAYDGAPQWTRLAGSSNTDFATAVAADASSNAYVAGLTSGAFDGETNAGGSAYFLIKYLPDGTRAWSRIRGAAAGTTAAALAVPAAPLLVLAGDTAGALDGQPFAGMLDTLLCAWTLDGTQLWTRVRGTATDEWLRAVAVRDSLICAAGSCLGSMDGQPFVGREDALLMAYDTNGTWRWTRTRGSDDDDTVTGVALDRASNIYLTGYTFGAFDGQVNRGGADIFLIKYDAAGTHQWTRFRG